MIEPQGVVHFSIAVSDLAASRRFYTEILGLNFQEVYQRSGVYKMPSPSGLGSEAAGAVEKLDASAGAVFALVVKGVLKPNINARYALTDVARAHADLEAGRTVGASLLIP